MVEVVAVVVVVIVVVVVVVVVMVLVVALQLELERRKKRASRVSWQLQQQLRQAAGNLKQMEGALHSSGSKREEERDTKEGKTWPRPRHYYYMYMNVFGLPRASRAAKQQRRICMFLLQE